MPEWTELSKIALQGLTLVVAGIGLVFAICQLRLLTTTYNDFHEWNRRKAAQDAIEKYTDIQEYYPLLNAKSRIMEFFDPVSLDLIRKECEVDSSLRPTLHRVLNYFEALAVGCGQGVYDEQVVGNAFKAVFIRTLKQFEAYIGHRRSAGAIGAWSQFEQLAKKWRSEEEEKVERRPQTGRDA